MDGPPAGRARPIDAGTTAISVGVALVTVAAPAAIGGAHPVTQVALSFASLGLLVAYLLLRGERGLRAVPFAGAAAVALGYTVLQVVPLPPAVVGLLSPAALAVRADVAGGRWIPLSLDTPATWLAVARGAGCLALLLVVGGIARARRRPVALLLTVVAMTSALLAIVAVAQRLAGTQAILGFYRPRSTPGFGVFGTFVDVNHAASLLALGALIAVGRAWTARDGMRALYVVCAVLSAAALVYTGSRGALVGFAIGAFSLVSILAARSIGTVRALGAGCVLLLVGAAVTVWASEGLRHRFATQRVLENQKTRGWRDGLSMALAYPWTGVGRGAFGAAIGAYRSDDEQVRLVYPENIVVQVASEWGVPMLLLLVVMIAATTRRLAPSLRDATPGVVAGACGVVAVVVHDLMDFGLELPGVAIPTMVTLACVAGRLAGNERSSERQQRVPLRVSLPLVAAGFVAVAVAAGMCSRTLEADFDRLKPAVREGHVEPATLRAAIARHPADDFLELLAAEDAYRHGRADALHHVNRALILHPVNWQAHRLAALMLAAMNRPAQAALEYRSALETGMGFDPRELARVLHANVVDAVPQTTERLLKLARELYIIGMSGQGDAAAQRAVDVAEARVPALMARAQLVLDINAQGALAPAGRALLAEADSAESVALAARALSRAGRHDESAAAIAAGRRRFPTDASVSLVGAELRIAAGDFAGARSLLAQASHATLTLAQRQRAEELLADVAERDGDSATAVLARTRSRLIAKQRHDMTLSGKGNEKE